MTNRHRAEFFRSDSTSVFQRAASIILSTAEASRDPVILMMPGGRTITGVCGAIMQVAQKHPDAMKKLILFETDSFAPTSERPETNWDVLRKGLMEPARKAEMMDDAQFWPVEILPDEEATASTYGMKLRGLGNIPRIVVLGAGGGEFSPGIEDPGHVAGIFPGSRFFHLWQSNKPYAVLRGAPKAPAVRYTVTPKYICRSDVVIGLITTDGKRNALQNYDAGMPPESCPIRLVDFVEDSGKGYLLTDIKG